MAGFLLRDDLLRFNAADFRDFADSLDADDPNAGLRPAAAPATSPADEFRAFADTLDQQPAPPARDDWRLQQPVVPSPTPAPAAPTAPPEPSAIFTAPQPGSIASGFKIEPATATTAELSGAARGTGGLTDRARSIMSGAADIAAPFGADSQKALQAILVTEGGMSGARGDKGQSAGPLQFYAGGQLANFARQKGLSLDDAMTYVERNPIEAVQWAIGTPERPGYLGAALKRGYDQGLRRADLATFAQRTGQVSISPERAGANYNALFGGGGPAITGAPALGAQEGQVAPTAPAPAARPAFAAPISATAEPEPEPLQKPSGSPLDQFREFVSSLHGPDDLAGTLGGLLPDITRSTLEPSGPLARVARGEAVGPADLLAPLAQTLGTAPSAVQQTLERADELLRQHPELGQGAQPLELGKPLGPQLGVDPLGQLQRGIPDIIEGVRGGDAERVVSGVLQVAGAVGSTLPGAAGPEIRALGRAAAARGAEAVPEAIAPRAAAAAAPEGLPVVRQPGNFLAPVRQVPELETSDLLASLAQVARERGINTSDVERTISALDPVAAARRALAPGARAATALPGDVGDVIRWSGALEAGPETVRDAARVLRPGGRIDWDLLAQLRREAETPPTGPQPPLPGMPTPPTVPEPALTPGQKVAAFLSSNLLFRAGNTFMNLVSQGEQVARAPIIRALAGYPDEAVAGIEAFTRASADTIGPVRDVLLRGRQRAGALEVPRADIPWYAPGVRTNVALDEAFRIMGGAQGQAMEAARLLRANPGVPGEQVLRQNMPALAEAGRRGAAESVFAEGGGQLGVARALSDIKQNLLADPNPGKQALGVLMHMAVPFLRIPEVLYTLGVRRMSPLNEAVGLVKIGQALRAGDVRAARLAAAETALDSTINAAILGYALAGNIHGPTDPEHPNQLRLPDGAWFDYRALGPLALRLSLISSVVDAGADEANKLNPNVLRAGLNASAQMLSKEWYTMGILDLLMAMGQGRFAEGASRFITQKGDMLTPVGAALNEIEKIRDPLMRDPTQNLPAALWERQQSRIPGLAEMLPPRVSTTTGEPLRSRRQGALEAILGITSEPSDPQKAELARLARLSY